MGNKIVKFLLKLGNRPFGCSALAVLAGPALILGLILTPGPVFATGQLSFDQALYIMNNNNEAIKAGNMEKSAREKERDAAKGLYYPTISASGKYTKIDEPIVIDLNPIGDVISTLHGLPSGTLPDFAITAQEDEFIKGSIVATWPVFTGGRITAVNDAAVARVKEAGEKIQQTKSLLTSDMVKRYYGLRLYEKVIGLRRDYLAGVEKHLTEARALEQNGIISKAERLHAQVAVAEARRELKKTIRNRDMIRTALANILTMDREEGLNINATSPLFLVRKLPALADLIHSSEKNNPILRQIKAKKELALQGLEYEKGFLYPEVFFFGKRELYKKDLTLLEPEWAAGIGVNIPLFEGMGRMNKIKAARDVSRQVSYLEAKAIRDIATLTEKRYHEVMKQIEQFDSLEATIELATEALRVRTRAFEEGFATSLDVVDAHLTLSGAKIQRLTSVYSFEVALAQLLEASGMSNRFKFYQSQNNLEETF